MARARRVLAVKELSTAGARFKPSIVCRPRGEWSGPGRRLLRAGRGRAGTISPDVVRRARSVASTSLLDHCRGDSAKVITMSSATAASRAPQERSLTIVARDEQRRDWARRTHLVGLAARELRRSAATHRR